MITDCFMFYSNTVDRMCTSEKCYTLSAKIRNWADLEQNPCDDFYQFACGGFMNNSELTTNDTVLNEFLDLSKIHTQTCT